MHDRSQKLSDTVKGAREAVLLSQGDGGFSEAVCMSSAFLLRAALSGSCWIAIRMPSFDMWKLYSCQACKSEACTMCAHCEKFLHICLLFNCDTDL